MSRSIPKSSSAAKSVVRNAVPGVFEVALCLVIALALTPTASALASTVMLAAAMVFLLSRTEADSARFAPAPRKVTGNHINYSRLRRSGRRGASHMPVKHRVVRCTRAAPGYILRFEVTSVAIHLWHMLALHISTISAVAATARWHLRRRWCAVAKAVPLCRFVRLQIATHSDEAHSAEDTTMQPTQAVQQVLASSQPRGAVSRFQPHLLVANSRPRNVGGACGGRNDGWRNLRTLPRAAAGALLAAAVLAGCETGYSPPARDWKSGGGWENFRAEVPASGPMLAEGQPGQ